MRRKSARNLVKAATTTTTETPVRTTRRSTRRVRRPSSSASGNSEEERPDVKIVEHASSDDDAPLSTVDDVKKVTPGDDAPPCVASPSPKRPGKSSGGGAAVQQEETAPAQEVMPLRRTRRRGSPKPPEEAPREDDEEDKKGKGKSKGKNKSKIEKIQPVNEPEAHNEREISENVQVTPQSPQTNSDNPVDNERVTVIESVESAAEAVDENESDKSPESEEGISMSKVKQRARQVTIKDVKNSSSTKTRPKNSDAPEPAVLEELVAENIESAGRQSPEKEQPEAADDPDGEGVGGSCEEPGEIPEEIVQSTPADNSNLIIVETDTVCITEHDVKTAPGEEVEQVIEFSETTEKIVELEIVEGAAIEYMSTEVEAAATVQEENMMEEPEEEISQMDEVVVSKVEEEEEEEEKTEQKSDKDVEPSVAKSPEILPEVEDVQENDKRDLLPKISIVKKAPSHKSKSNKQKVKISRNFDPDEPSRVTVHRKKWGNAPVGLDVVAPHLVQVDLEAVKSFCQSFRFPDESEVKLERVEPKDRRKTERKKSERKVSADERPVYASQPSESRSFKSGGGDDDDDNREPVEVDNSNIIAMNRKISIVDDSASKLKPPPSPARNPTSDVLYITNLVRPFTLKQLKELLERTGRIVERGFWTDRIKSKCYVQYETVEEAEATRDALHGVHWPIGNGKKLMIDYTTVGDLENTRNPPAPPPPPPPVPVVIADVNKIEKDDEELQQKEELLEHKVKERSERSDRDRDRERHRSEHVREWDVGKENLQRARSRERHDKRKQHRSPSPADDFISRKHKKTEEQLPQKLMDDLFQKTKATPSIYWQPLTPEEIATKQRQRLERMAEHKRRMEETSRNRAEYGGGGGGGGRGGPYRRRYD